MIALEPLLEEMKPLRLKVFWPKAKVQVSGGLLDGIVQSVHACGNDIRIFENITGLACLVRISDRSRQEVRLAWLTVSWTSSA